MRINICFLSERILKHVNYKGDVFLQLLDTCARAYEIYSEGIVP